MGIKIGLSLAYGTGPHKITINSDFLFLGPKNIQLIFKT